MQNPAQQAVSEVNQAVPPAVSGEFNPPQLGRLTLWPPVVLAPMAGITNAPFRRLCRHFGAGLYVSEMITARFLASREPRALRQAAFHESESPRSIQLYGVDPYHVGEAVAVLREEIGVDHIDLNFRCPVRKVTKKGGGAAIPLKPRLLGNIVRAAVSRAGEIPVTLKFRVGIDDSLPTYLSTGRVAEEEGCAAVALHARTAAQYYDGEARWDFIRRLKETVRIPVLGNGDIWEAGDALRMMRQTGCDGVVIGRGCLGRPWLFRDLAAVFEGRNPGNPPNSGEIAKIMRLQLQMSVDWFGERLAVSTFRKHAHWYLKDFPDLKPLRDRLVRITAQAELDTLLGEMKPDIPFPVNALRVPRGKTNPPQKVQLPPGYLDQLDDDRPPGADAEDMTSGG